MLFEIIFKRGWTILRLNKPVAGLPLKSICNLIFFFFSVGMFRSSWDIGASSCTFVLLFSQQQQCRNIIIIMKHAITFIPSEANID